MPAQPSRFPGAFERVEIGFWAACRGPRPLTLPTPARPGQTTGGRREVVLSTLREVLLGRGTVSADGGFDAADGVWEQLVLRAQAEPGRWTVGVAGMLLPCLRRKHAMLTRGRLGRDSTASLELETGMISGLYEALRTADASSGRLPSRLCWAAYRAGRRLRDADEAWTRMRGGRISESQIPPAPCGHPDLILAHAVGGGLITAAEADLIGRTRLEGQALARVAADVGVGAHALTCRRLRAEARLVAALRDGTLSRYGYWPNPAAPPPARRDTRSRRATPATRAA